MMMITLSMTSVDMPLPAPVSCGVIQTRHIIRDPQLSSELHTLTHSVWVISLHQASRLEGRNWRRVLLTIKMTNIENHSVNFPGLELMIHMTNMRA